MHRTQRQRLPIFSLYALLVCAIGATAQADHPLAGTWRGKWITTEPASSAAIQENFVVAFKSDDGNVTGTFNPGRFGSPLKIITFNRADMTVHIELDIREGHVVANGKLENSDSPKPTLAGTWTQGSEKGEFHLTRD